MGKADVAIFLLIYQFACAGRAGLGFQVLGLVGLRGVRGSLRGDFGWMNHRRASQELTVGVGCAAVVVFRRMDPQSH